MKLVLEIKDQKIEVTMDEAKNIFNELKEIFEKRKDSSFPPFPYSDNPNVLYRSPSID